jgi:dTDP-L-rhamnose 4-epimerase
MKIIITGGAGFIGSNLAIQLSANDCQIIIIDNLSPQIHGLNSGWPIQLLDNKNITLCHSDFENFDSYLDHLNDADCIVHLAAETGTGQSMYSIEHYTNVNISGTASLLERISKRKIPLKKFVFASSRSIYGEGSYLDDEGRLQSPSSRKAHCLNKGLWEHYSSSDSKLRPIPTAEYHSIRPASIYAATKYSSELYCQIISESFGIPMTILRFQNIYGPGQSLNNPYTGILSIFSNQLRLERPINIYEDGLESRDFLFISDAVASLILALSHSDSIFNVFNVGTGVGSSVLSVAKQLKTLLKSDSDLKISGDFRLGDIRHCFADTFKASNELGFSSKVDIEEGLYQFVEWVLKNPPSITNPDNALTEMMALGLAGTSKK